MWNMIVPLALGAYSAFKGGKASKQAQGQQALATMTAERDDERRMPFRNLANQTLGNVEGAIDMGNHSYNPSNPFAAAQGPGRSIAYAGGWDQNTFTAPLETPESRRIATSQFGVDSARASAIGGNSGAKQRVLARVQSAIDADRARQPGNVTASPTYGWNR